MLNEYHKQHTTLLCINIVFSVQQVKILYLCNICKHVSVINAKELLDYSFKNQTNNTPKQHSAFKEKHVHHHHHHQYGINNSCWRYNDGVVRPRLHNSFSEHIEPLLSKQLFHVHKRYGNWSLFFDNNYSCCCTNLSYSIHRQK